MATMMQAMFNENEGEIDQMVVDLEAALDGFRELGDRWGTSLALRGLASYQGSAGDHAGALESLTEALRLIGELGTKEGVAQLLAQGAMNRAELGDLDGARADLDQALRLSAEGGSRGGQAIATIGLSIIARRSGELEQAQQLAEKAHALLDLRAERMAPHGHALVMSQRARTAVALGELAAAREHSNKSLELAVGTEDMPVVSSIVEAAADVDLLAGDPEHAALLLGIAAALRGMRSQPDSDVRRTAERLREALGTDRYGAAYDQGATMSRDDAMAEIRKIFSSS
jgi:tetratricopeptide (TPR) repeat protein